MIRNDIKVNNENLEVKDLGDVEQKISQKDWSWRDMISAIIWGCLLTLQIVLSIIFFNYLGLIIPNIIGWIIFILAMVIGRLAINEFKKMGGVPEDKSPVYTTRLVNTGIYSIIRHPQWLTFMFYSIFLALIGQHWLNIICCLIVVSILYYETYGLDQGNAEKFEKYKDYIQKVPRINIFLGLIKKLYRKEV